MKKENVVKKDDTVQSDIFNENGHPAGGGGDISNVHFDRIYIALGVCVILFVIAWLLGM